MKNTRHVLKVPRERRKFFTSFSYSSLLRKRHPDSADFDAEKRVKSLMGQDRDCRQGDPISPIPGDECVLLCPLLCGVLHYRPRTKPLEQGFSGGGTHRNDVPALLFYFLLYEVYKEKVL
ncbi:hypothetical protein AVEN_181843-1 [Araneus ventricosus]|uniref:Uncharacterized protein n=1 Tax=Araneus ventricosus TaxID=182803 RepID=A0A4Y2EZ96_ARAVE|nr:hypothetical protein AVEN_181843-1 [Araneus ventricosus]